MKLIFALLLALPCFVLSQNTSSEIEELRNEHLQELLDSSSHILMLEEIETFQGLDYFEYDSTYSVVCKLKRRPGKPFEMVTTTERRPVYRSYGHVIFNLNGKKNKLEIFQPVINIENKEYGDYLFIPFRDLTSSKESYGGGRYIDLDIPVDKHVTIDFNLCYNPYCAYSHRYSCPVPPEQNDLEIRIEAGEKSPLAH